MDLNAVWFLLLGLLLSGYAVLDGFDLGVGILHLLAKNDTDRRLFINSIGPIWDGNEVWLVVFGGALFAAFPNAYASVFSGFYLPFMLLLFALVFRAVSIEFRSKMKSQSWRRIWDIGFFGSSTLATLLFGVAVGNSMVGLPLDNEGYFSGSFFDLLNPYALMSGLVAVALFAMHGAIYLVLKLPDGPARERVRGWIWHTWGTFLVLYILGTIYTLTAVPRATANFRQFPWAAIVVILNVLAVANIPRAVYRNKPIEAFLSSTIAIMCLVGLFSIALWPNLVTASNNPDHSLTVYNAASSTGTLWNMLIVVMIGMPFVLTYTVAVYWTFRGRVELGEHSY
ncbi:MAG TPA: cytochrome d ubiquinol oxidase subunit II [Bryobacteraceae bacterium]|nr:cytochrome d ubiquinol oxidase subunit II [Bryobacteraceae bacterium]